MNLPRPGNPSTRREFLAELVSAAAALGFPLHAATPPARTSSASRLRFSFAPLADLYLMLRKAAREPTALPAELSTPLMLVQRAEQRLPARLRSTLVAGLVAEHDRAAEFSAAAHAAPEVASGGVPLRTTLVEVAAALTLAEPAYERHLAAERRRIVEEALEGRVRRVLLPRERECLTFLQSGLALPAPDVPIPTFLVADAPEPAGFTYRSPRYGAACVVGIQPHPGTTLLEAILHEATHAIETLAAAAGEEAESVLTRLQRELRERGMPASDPLIRDVPHTLMFVHSGEAVRRILDDAHVHYGDSHGYYARLPRAALAVRCHWTRHLDGMIPRDEAIAHIVVEVLAGRDRPAGDRPPP